MHGRHCERCIARCGEYDGIVLLSILPAGHKPYTVFSSLSRTDSMRLWCAQSHYRFAVDRSTMPQFVCRTRACINLHVVSDSFFRFFHLLLVPIAMHGSYLICNLLICVRWLAMAAGCRCVLLLFIGCNFGIVEMRCSRIHPNRKSVQTHKHEKCQNNAHGHGVFVPHMCELI